MRCRHCELVYAEKLPSAHELEQHYAEYPPSPEISPLTARRYTELLERLEPVRQTNRLLDIGCGDGQFLLAARGRGWSVYGSEYGEGPRRRALEQGLDVREAPFPAAQHELGTFDVVTAIEVLEHVTSPRDEILRIAELLRPGGCAYLTTPNFASISRRLLGARWRAVEYPEHLNLFTPATLNGLLAHAGLRRTDVRTTGISPSDIWAATKGQGSSVPNHAGTTRSLDERVRRRVGASWILETGLRVANVGLSWLGIGDTIKAFYRRP